MEMASKSRKKSFVWDYFHVCEEDVRKAVCNSCGAVMVRGRDTRSYSTSSLANHIKYCKEIPPSKRRRLPIRLPRKRKSDSNINVLLFDDSAESQDAGTKRKFRRQSDEIEHEDAQIAETGPNIALPKSTDIYISPDPRYRATNDAVCSKRMDLVHTGLLMNVLYQQHRCGKLCDLTLISSPQANSSMTTISQTDSLVASAKKRRKKVFKAHSSVLSALSSKIKALIEMGSRTIELKDVTAFGLQALLEIVYTGKLKRTSPLTFYEAHQVWKSASDLGIRYVHEYLATEHPQVAKWITEDSLTPEPLKAFTFNDLTETHETDDLIDLHAGHDQQFVTDILEAQEGEVVPVSEEGKFEEFTPQVVEESGNTTKTEEGSLVEITFAK